jgi:hypothetical protein
MACLDSVRVVKHTGIGDGTITMLRFSYAIVLIRLMLQHAVIDEDKGIIRCQDSIMQAGEVTARAGKGCLNE